MHLFDTISAIQKKARRSLFNKANVVGAGIGYKETRGIITDELSLVVLVDKKLDKEMLTAKDVIPDEINGVRTDVIRVGRLKASRSVSEKFRPAPPGVSIGHFNVHAGTFGAVVYDNKTSEPLILSNNHVLANCNRAKIKDPILQPGPIDGGLTEADVLALLYKYKKILFRKSCSESEQSFFVDVKSSLINFFRAVNNLICYRTLFDNDFDAAVARPVNPSLINNEILHIGKVSGVTDAVPGMNVRKSGQMTNLTTGKIKVVNVEMNISYPNEEEARFKGIFLTTLMSQSGDSGSLLVDEHCNAVGLLFSGSDEVTAFNPVKPILNYFNVRIIE